MALASFHVKIISRGKGKSAVAAAAYRAGIEIYNEYDGKTHDYSRRKDVIYSVLLMPSHAPDWNVCQLMNEVEKAEPQHNSQLARQIEFALQQELTQAQNIQLAQEYASRFVEKGMAASLSVHDKGDGNPHAHIMLTMRPFNPDGTWGEKSRKEYILDENGDRIRLPSGQWKSRRVNTTDWDNRDNVEIWREQYAELTNRYLERYGHEARIDHRSYERQEIELIPTIHLGHYAHRLEQQGIESDRGNINRQIEQANQKIQEIKERVESLETLAEQGRQRPEASTPPIHRERAINQQELEKQSAEVQETSGPEPVNVRYNRLMEYYARAAQAVQETAAALQDRLTEKGKQDLADQEQKIESVRKMLRQQTPEQDTPDRSTQTEREKQKQQDDFRRLYETHGERPPVHTRVEESERKQHEYDALYDAAKQKRKEHRIVRDPERQNRRYQDAYQQAEERDKKISRREQTTHHGRPEPSKPERQPDFQEQYRIAERRHHELERQKRRYSRSRDDPDHEK